MIKKTIILILAFFWSYNLNSSENTWITKKDVEIGYSGTYHGIKCTKKKSACVDSSDQGKGIIKNSFTKILKLKIFKINKFKKIFLGVDEKNLNAVKLYKKLGFKYEKNSKKIMYLNL